MHSEVKGLVLRTTDVKDSDRMLSVYSAERGLISVYSRGSKSLKSRNMSTTGQFCYSEMVLYERGDKLWIQESRLIENFYNLREDIEAFAVASYACEVLEDVGTAEGDSKLLQLTLNTLFALSSGKYRIPLVKAAFEVRMCALLGLMPDVISCQECGEREGEAFLDILEGETLCRDCHEKRQREAIAVTDTERRVVCILSEGARAAFAYCLFCPAEKLLAFSVEGEDAALFSRAAEAYILNHLERSYKSLDFYYEVRR